MPRESLSELNSTKRSRFMPALSLPSQFQQLGAGKSWFIVTEREKFPLESRWRNACFWGCIIGFLMKGKESFAKLY